MDKLLASITEITANTPPEKIEQLANQLRKVDNPASSASLSSWAIAPVARDRLRKLVESWRNCPLPSDELAAMLTGAAYAYKHAKAESDIELVWTGPSSELVAMRKTEQALLQVIDVARERFFLTSFVAYDVAAIMNALAAASERGVEISMLLESSDAHGGGVSIDGIGHMKKVLPSARIYFWGDKADGFVGGKVHAKVAVADERMCFLSSANLTGYAMEMNMEAGVLIQGGSIPVKLHRHLEALITTKIIERV
ncbi:MAG: DISARM system phospholipase D-like protein DrmC [Rhodospirillales bacterium]